MRTSARCTIPPAPHLGPLVASGLCCDRCRWHRRTQHPRLAKPDERDGPGDQPQLMSHVLTVALQSATQAELLDTMKEVDLDGSGLIDFDEVLRPAVLWC